MTTTEQTPEQVPSTTMTTASPRRRALLAALALLALALLLPPLASADSRFGEFGTGAGQLSYPAGVAVSAKEGGDVYVADSGNFRIDEFEPDGHFLRAFGWGVNATTPEEKLQTCTAVTGCRSGSPGTEPGQLFGGRQIAVDNSCAEQKPPLEGHECEAFDPAYGDLYVADSSNYRVERFGPTGEFQLMFGRNVDKGPHHPGNLCTAAYLAEGDSCGAGEPGSTAGSFQRISSLENWRSVQVPHSDAGGNSIAIGPGGTVYVGDYRRVEEFSPAGAYLGERDLPAAGEPEFVNMLAADPAGDLYAGSMPLDEYQEFTRPASGSFTLTFEGQETVAIPYNAPMQGCSSSEPNCVTIQGSLEALSTIGAGNVTVAIGTESNQANFQVKFIRALGSRNVPPISFSAGPTTTLAEGTPGELVRIGPAGEVLQSYDRNGVPAHIATDSLGDLYVVDVTAGEYTFRAYKQNGDPLSVFTSPEVIARYVNKEAFERETEPGAAFTDPGGIAFDASGTALYASNQDKEQGGSQSHVAVISPPQPGPPQLLSQSASNLEPTTANLNAALNPQGHETFSRFEYLTEAEYQANPPGERFLGAARTPTRTVEPLIQEDHVQAGLAGLHPGTSYRFRAVLESECEPEAHPSEKSCVVEGPADTFATLPPVSIRDFGTQVVAPEEVRIKAELSPNNGTATEWEICYGPSAGNYSAGCAHGRLEGASGNEFGKIGATFEHLTPNTEYHYRLTASNSYVEPVETADRVFTTEESAAEERAAEDCPNNGTVHGAPGGSTLREQDNSTALPDCRAYEQVSPPDKEASAALPTVWLAPSGEGVLFKATGAFAGAEHNEYGEVYVSHRGVSAWSTLPAVGRPAGPGQEPGWVSVASPQLDRWLFPSSPGFQGESPRRFATEATLYRRDDSGAFQPASPPLSLLEASPTNENYFSQPFDAADDLSRLYIGTVYRLLPEPEDPRPSENRAYSEASATRVYEVSGASGPNPAIRLVAELPLGLGQKQSELCSLRPQFGEGGEGYGRLNERRVSVNGATLVYMAPIEEQAGAHCGEGTPNPYGIFARTAPDPAGPAVLTQLNVETGCTSPHPCFGAPPRLPSYDGVSASGRLVWFTTRQPLTDSDEDTGAAQAANDLYLAKLDESGHMEQLVQASHGEASDPTPGQGAGVQGVVEVSPDGTHAAFVATGALTAEPNAAGDRAAQGADNLYVYDATSGAVKFVARLCSATARSGELEESACPATSPHEAGDPKLWSDAPGAGPEVHFTPDGRYLLFTSVGRLVPGDTDAARDVYRYDFQTGRLLRLSFGHRGNDMNGNSALPALIATQNHAGGQELGGPGSGPMEDAEDVSRAISAEGSLVAFTTTAPLVSTDTNEAEDVYEWEEEGHGSCAQGEDGSGGCVFLVSDGVDPRGATNPVVSASGADIAFYSQRNLIPADTDGVGDVYDAREGGGFPYVAPPPHPSCLEGSAESCHGPATEASLHPSYTSGETHHGPEGEKEHLQCAKGKHKVKKHGQVRCVSDRRPKHRRHHKHKRAARVNRGGGK